jgi:hypothetical protein
MATYVNNLRLKEIATGDESGTWGTSTNTNLDLIADSFSLGTKQMAADANETFTMPDATADGVRSLYLKITSAASLTATREVTLGPNTISKVWIIENATTGSQIITIKQGSGATVNVANGSKIMVVTDGAGTGAAVFNASPTETGGTVTSVGGTGTVNGISLSGTVTSSGNLTLGGALTGVDLTTQVTGTLPIANGGTGTTSTTFADLTTNVTGTLPLANGGTNGTTAAAAATSLGLGTASNVQHGSLGIGTAASGTTGEIRATNNVTAYYSDNRLKTRLGPIEDALAKVNTLSGFYYEANEVAQALGYTVKKEVGVSAQEVQAVLPEIVVPAPIDDKYLTVHYEKMVPLLIEAIKELAAKVETLENS